MSRAQIRGVLNLLPPGSTIVEEDASVDLLLRAAYFAGRQSTRLLAVIPLSRRSVLDALNAGPVFAFPAGQHDLALRGFGLEPVMTATRIAGRGIAAVSGPRACVELGKTCVDLDGVGTYGRVALVADSDNRSSDGRRSGRCRPERARAVCIALRASASLPPSPLTPCRSRSVTDQRRCFRVLIARSRTPPVPWRGRFALSLPRGPAAP
jgi:hypothetical protein